MIESMLSKSVKGLSSSDLVGSFGGISDRYVCEMRFCSLVYEYRAPYSYLFTLFHDTELEKHLGLSIADIYSKEAINRLSPHSIRQKK
jgi:hypothetical protein